MIEKLAIKKFKSIKELDIDCRRINLFIGEPNTGKSNILEAIGLLSWIGHPPHKKNLNNYLRFEGLEDLYFDSLIDEKMMIAFSNKKVQCFTTITFKYDKFIIESKLEDKEVRYFDLDHSGGIKSVKSDASFQEFSFVKYYKFLKQSNFPDTFFSCLLPPNGSNLFSLIMSNKRIREMVNILVKDLDLKLMLKPKEKKIEIAKQKDDMIFSYPYIATSDTLQRVIFFSAAMESNEKSTLIFEEPESFAFPYYTKYLGERIAFDESNQYFISTHNPYLLLAILEKTPKDSVNVFVTYLKDYETKAKALTGDEISVLMDSDPFFNLKKFIDEE
jgi:AAA15 family ATPase/GTPase